MYFIRFIKVLSTVYLAFIGEDSINSTYFNLNNDNVFESLIVSLSLLLFPFIRGDVLPATLSPPHLLVFSTLLCLLSSSSRVCFINELLVRS